MCGRFATNAPLDALLAALGVDGEGRPLGALIEPRADVRPGAEVAAVPNAVDPSGHRRLELFRWGMVAHWARARAVASAGGATPTRPRPHINARGETLTEKPSFREAARRRRAIVPASHFYEWQPAPSGRGPKRPFAIRRADGAPLAMGAIFEEWWDPQTGEVLRSLAIVTTDANADVRPIHDRMPLVVERVDFDRWLAPGVLAANDLRALTRPAPDGTLVAEPLETFPTDRPARATPPAPATPLAPATRRHGDSHRPPAARWPER
jgi:putative SOS response-associated peptidase YedK